MSMNYINLNGRQFRLVPVVDEVNVYNVEEHFVNGEVYTFDDVFTPVRFSEHTLTDDKIKQIFFYWLDLIEERKKDYTIFIGNREYSLEGIFDTDNDVWGFNVFEITRYDNGEKMCTMAIGDDVFIPCFTPVGRTTDELSAKDKELLSDELEDWLKYNVENKDDNTQHNTIKDVWVLTVQTKQKNSVLSSNIEYYVNGNDAVMAMKSGINSVLDVLGRKNFTKVSDYVSEGSYYERYCYSYTDIELIFDLCKQIVR